MLFLLLISILPIFGFGVGPILFAAFLSALSWNYFFIPPHYTFHIESCLLYTSDAADERSSVDLGGRRIIKKKKK